MDKKLFSEVIVPINSLQEFVGKPYCRLVHPKIYTSDIVIKNITFVPKTITFIPLLEGIKKDEIMGFLRRLDKKPVVDPVNYLLGSMAYLKDDDFTDIVDFNEFVAFSEQEMKISDGRDCWMYGRYNPSTKIREVCPIPKAGLTPSYYLLAEDLGW